MMKFLSKFYMFIVFALLYAPIVVLIIFSFNEAGSLNEFSKFSFDWYKELFKDEQAFSALKNSLILAVSSSLLSTLIATLCAIGLHYMKNKYFKSSIKAITNIPTSSSRSLSTSGVEKFPFAISRASFAIKINGFTKSPINPWNNKINNKDVFFIFDI